MRIIAGEFKGASLRTPTGANTRPTTDRVRESLMSMLVSARGGLAGAVVWDAFAGSGALGFEAISRGAHAACFSDTSRAALATLASNAAKLGLESDRVHIMRGDAYSCIPRLPASDSLPFDVVFFDPPYAYHANELCSTFVSLRARGTVAADAFLVYEHAKTRTNEADEAYEHFGLTCMRRKRYGDTVVDMVCMRKDMSQ